MNSGKTHDGYDVTADYGLQLRFTPIVFEQETGSRGFGVSVERNADANGKRWPYMVIWCGKHIIQSGWLWS